MTLFSDPAGKSARQLSLEQEYLRVGVDLEAVIQQAYKITLSDSTPPHFRGRGFMANHMSWNVVGVLKQNYLALMGEDEKKRPYLKLNRYARVYFKKLNFKYAPENIPTEHVREMNTMSLFSENVKITVLYAGFRVRQDEFWDELTGSYLVEMKTLDNPNWVSDLSELSAQINKGNSQSVVPITPIILPDDIAVTGKRHQTRKAE